MHTLARIRPIVICLPHTDLPYEVPEEFLPEIEIVEEDPRESEFYKNTLRDIEELLQNLSLEDA